MRQQTPLFPLGPIVATAGAVAEIPILEIHAALDRHAAGDWGGLCEDDRLANERALAEGERLLSSYESFGVTFWIITERDRSLTTVLLPEDY